MKKIFSSQIIKQSFKSVWIWWLISFVVTSLNLFAFPSATGIDANNTNLLPMFVNEGIGGNGIIFITICVVLFANVLITSEVDRGTLAVTLNTPTTRLQLLLSKALVSIILLISMCLLVGVSGAISPLLYNLEFDFTKWWIVIILWTLYSLALGGISYAIGCWFNKSRYTLGIASALLGAFFILNMFAGIENLEFCKYFTLQTLYDTVAIIDGKSVLWQMIVLPVIGCIFYLIGTIKFLKKDLPL